MCDEIPRAAIEAVHQAWTERTEAPMPSETHRRVLPLDDELPRTAEGMLIGWPERDDPDGPLEPMRLAAVWRRDAVAEWREAARRTDRDAALIAAIGKLWG